eukprot:4162780-Pyramimonas_sp.AAC.1
MELYMGLSWFIDVVEIEADMESRVVAYEQRLEAQAAVEARAAVATTETALAASAARERARAQR